MTESEWQDREPERSPATVDPSFPARWEEDSLALNITRGVSGLTSVGVAGLTTTRLAAAGGLPESLFGAAWLAIGVALAVVFAGFAIGGGGQHVRGAFKKAVVGATVLGGASFAAGFLGPIIFTPDANQGPLLGILITGPLGVAAGALGGFLYGLLFPEPNDR